MERLKLLTRIENLHSQLEACRKENQRINKAAAQLFGEGRTSAFAKMQEQLTEANEKLNLIRKDEGMQNRMLELFETRRESDERLKIAVEALENLNHHARGMAAISNVFVELVTRDALAKIRK